ncbi:hypothetical protein LBMAG48_28460 [Phycisphaerae bacterium]|nr:hypothetical protein LBMAG48_28460 [Phycisphaerae bacterium]
MLSARQKLAAEFFATFALVFAGCGAIVINQISNGQISHVGIGLTFGLIVMAMIYAVGDVSGAHLNPAVTIAFAACKRFSWRDVPGYVAAQCAGAIAAAGCLRLLFRAGMFGDQPGEITPPLGQTLPRSTSSEFGATLGSALQSFTLEIILTAILMAVILRVSTGPKEKGITAALAVGGVVALEAIFAGPISGASMNPARSLGPALVAWDFRHLWVYLLAPILGALAGAAINELISPHKQQTPPDK